MPATGRFPRGRVLSRVRIREVTRLLERQVDACESADVESRGPIDDRLRAKPISRLKEIHVARAAEGRAQIDGTVADFLMRVDQTAEPLGLVKIAAAFVAFVRVDFVAFEQRDGRQNFEDRSRRERRLEGAMKQGSRCVYGQSLPGGGVRDAGGAQVEP